MSATLSIRVSDTLSPSCDLDGTQVGSCPGCAAALPGMGLVSAELRARAASLYEPALPYHRFAHAEDVAERATALSDRLGLPGRDRHLIEVAALLHDAGYAVAEPALREEFSAELAQSVLTQARYCRRCRSAVCAAILATHIDVEPRTVRERVLRAADLWGLGGPYDQFLVASRQLFAEAEMLAGGPVDAVRWRAGVADVRARYADVDGPRTEQFYPGWTAGLAANAARYDTED